MKNKKDKTVGYGFVGRWSNRLIGWGLPDGVANHERSYYIQPPSEYFNEYARPEDRAVLCKITVEVVHDKLGREIRRKPRKI